LDQGEELVSKLVKYFMIDVNNNCVKKKFHKYNMTIEVSFNLPSHSNNHVYYSPSTNPVIIRAI
jgi:hypothetical protein